MDAINAYADGTAFEDADGNRYVGAAVLFTEEPIKRLVTDEALDELRDLCNELPEVARKRSYETLDRGYFHATEDSSQAKECLGKSVVRHIRGQLDYSFANETRLENHEWLRSNMSEPSRMAQMIAFCMASVMTGNVRPIKLMIEDGDSYNPSQKNWWEHIWSIRERSAYDQPAIPATFPKIDVTYLKKTDPGSQVVDNLLWAVQRQVKIGPHDEWVNNCGLSLCHSASLDWVHSGSYSVVDELLIHQGYPSEVLKEFRDYQSSGEKIIHNAWTLVEGLLCWLSDNGPLPAHANHFQDELDNVVVNFRKGLASHNHILLELAGSLFLRLFDTGPVWEGFHKDKSKKRWCEYLRAKEIIGLALRKDLANGRHVIAQMSRQRKHMLEAIENKNPTGGNCYGQ